jgi:hypothetical protein
MFEYVKNSISDNRRRISGQIDKRSIPMESYGMLEIANAINNFTLAFIEQSEYRNKKDIDEKEGTK